MARPKWMGTPREQLRDFGELFNKYPDAPGYKREGTSREAAPDRTEASLLRLACRECLLRSPATADEVAGRLNRSVLAIRPRLSELVAQGKIEETGERRRNASGKMAAVWKAI